MRDSEEHDPLRARRETKPLINGHHPYLERERRIAAEALSHPPFAGRIYIDGHGNAVFLRWNFGNITLATGLNAT
ncbi:MAG: DUF3991 domain-containing protein [Verrucomicrobiales bacterium]|nr:DUF3991 domain-containing protein [Verrucomicrobiales bacterium]